MQLPGSNSRGNHEHLYPTSPTAKNISRWKLILVSSHRKSLLHILDLAREVGYTEDNKVIASCLNSLNLET